MVKKELIITNDLSSFVMRANHNVALYTNIEKRD